VAERFTGEILHENLLILARQYILSESLKRRPKKDAEPSKKADKNQSHVKKPSVESGGKRIEAIKSFIRIFPAAAVPKNAVSRKDGNAISIAYSDQSGKDRAQHNEAEAVIDSLSKKDQGAINAIAGSVLEARKYLTTEEYRHNMKVVLENKGVDPSNPEEVYNFATRDFERTIYKGRGSVQAWKQFVTLKECDKLLSLSHLKTYLRIAENIVEELQDDPKSAWTGTDLGALLRQNPDITKKDFEKATETPVWKRGELLGPHHPRVIALQIEEDYREGVLEAKDLTYIRAALKNKKLAWLFGPLTLDQMPFKLRDREKVPGSELK